MKEYVKIDGMRGEGGGQILRSSLSLSVLTGKPFKMTGIRSRRKRPGLMRQHLTAVRAAAEICGAEVEGDAINSTSLIFKPGEIKGGEYHFKIGTAGSSTLVLQTVLPPLLKAGTESIVVIEGGTHNMLAPPYDFLEKSFFRALKQVGINVDISLKSWGFYPAGGGRIEVKIKPWKKMGSFNLNDRGELVSKKCRAVISALPEFITERELSQVKSKLNWKQEELLAEELENPLGPGNVMLFELEYDNVTAVLTSFGEKGIAAEKVASNGVTRVRSYLTSEAVADEYLADQLLIPMAMAGSGEITCTTLSSHTMTNIDVIKKFLDVNFVTETISGNCFKITVEN